nr:elongation factor 1-alpha-like [Ziziphus jujuba var. spinosa]
MGHVDSSKSQVLDNLKAERERGNAMRELKIDKYHFTFIDAFGHPDFIKDILTGHCWADCALLIIDSTGTGDFDEQARLHALLAYTPGIKQMICCFNKMDANTPNYSWESYDEVLKSMSPYLKKLGYDPVKIPFFPIPGLEGDNLTERSTNLDWYKGPTLLDAFDQIKEPNRHSGKPLRPALEDVKIGRNGTVAYGRIEMGILKPGMKVKFEPIGVTAKVKFVKMNDESVQEALSGDCEKTFGS